MGKVFLGLNALLESEYEFVPEFVMEYVMYSLIKVRLENGKRSQTGACGLNIPMAYIKRS